ncbi:metal-dependent hydrolase [Actinomadura scrupuli]|uniref:metal-dependent hydrolase n=1 Tax=Actinomadura scrupuli TaxID=559629 RepID=UPI003D984153
MTASTLVNFPSGHVGGVSVIVEVMPVPGGLGVVVEETPFHPLDPTWPDQPADLGTITVGGTGHTVTDCVTAAVPHDGGRPVLGSDIPVRRGAEGWHWLVAHVVDAEPGDLAVGDEAVLAVDAVRRDALSAGHTGCHLVALALNETLGGRWRKEVPPDALGSPDFDRLAITSSRILEYGSRDEYRLGKSLRKKGFTTEGLDADLPELTRLVNERVREWVAEDAPVWIDAPGPELTARRTWHCGLRKGEASIACGGTHLRRTSELGAVAVTLELSADGTTLVMDTRVTVPAGAAS